MNGKMIKTEVGHGDTIKALKFSKTYDGGRSYPAPENFLAPTQQWGMWVHLHDGYRFRPHASYDPDKEVLLIWGAILYDDIYDTTWVTDFCYVYDGFNRFLPYRTGNSESEYSNREAAEKYVYG